MQESGPTNPAIKHGVLFVWRQLTHAHPAFTCRWRGEAFTSVVSGLKPLPHLSSSQGGRTQTYSKVRRPTWLVSVLSCARILLLTPNLCSPSQGTCHVVSRVLRVERRLGRYQGFPVTPAILLGSSSACQRSSRLFVAHLVSFGSKVPPSFQLRKIWCPAM